MGTNYFMAFFRQNDCFGGTVWGIGTRLAAVLEASLMVCEYVYVDDSQVSTHVAR